MLAYLELKKLFGSKTAFSRSFLSALILTSVFFCNPFNLRDASEEFSEKLTIRLLAPWYPGNGESEIAVVLFDDHFIRERGDKYPLNYDQFSSVLYSLSIFEPKAVFFDIAQHYGFSDGLEKWEESLTEYSFPIYLASNPLYDTPQRLNDPTSIRHKLSKISGVKLTAVAWPAARRGYYPLDIVPDDSGDSGENKQPHENAAVSSAAFDLYKEWCIGSKQCDYFIKTDNGHRNSILPKGHEGFFEEDLVVRWGDGVANNQKQLLGVEQCQDTNLNTLAKIKETGKRVWVELLYGVFNYDAFSEKSRKKCINMHTLSASSLFKDGAVSSKVLHEALNNKIVLVGYALKGSADTVISPLHGSMAGVFYHAMALDNLIRFGEGYWRNPSPLFMNITLIDIMEGGLQGIVLWLVFFYRRWWITVEMGVSTIEHVRGKFAILISLTIFTALLTFGITFFNNYGPVNWLSFLTIILFALPTLFTHTIKKWRGKIDKLLSTTHLNKNHGEANND